MPWVRCAFGNVSFVFVLLNCFRVVREQLVTCCTKLFQNIRCGGFARIYWFLRNCLMHVTDFPSGYNWTYLTSFSFLSSPSLSPLVAPPFPAVSIDLASTAEASEDTGQGSITPPIVKYKFQDYIFTRILMRILPPDFSGEKKPLVALFSPVVFSSTVASTSSSSSSTTCSTYQSAPVPARGARLWGRHHSSTSSEFPPPNI